MNRNIWLLLTPVFTFIPGVNAAEDDSAMCGR